MSILDSESQNQIIEQEVADAEDALILSALDQTPDWYKGSVAEAVDNMSRCDLDHLKGRECDPEEHCPRCDALRAKYDDKPRGEEGGAS